MKSLADQMSVYAAYHRHPVNKGIHFVGIPAIVWGLMFALGRMHLFDAGSLSVSLAHVAVAGLLVWYLMLDYVLGVASTVLFTVLLVTALELPEWAGSLEAAWAVAGVVFVLGWVVQFIGHGVWEKRRPALMDNLLQVFVAPIFLVAEFAFSLGAKKALHAEVQEKLKAHLPPA